MDNQYRQLFSRNIGVFTEAEQSMLRRATVAVAGMGGVGGLLAERLIRLGIGNLKIADPGTFEESNLNRQFSSSMRNSGRNKAESVFDAIQDINPGASIDYNALGIKTDADAASFVAGCDVVIDEMDFGAWKESILLQRAARARGIYYLFASAIGFGALSVVFDPKGMTLEEYNRLPSNGDIDSIKGLSVTNERILPVVPSYATAAMSLETMQEIVRGERPVPTCSIGAGLASILAASETLNIILKRKEIVVAPRYTYIDLLDRKFVTGKMA